MAFRTLFFHCRRKLMFNKSDHFGKFSVNYCFCNNANDLTRKYSDEGIANSGKPFEKRIFSGIQPTGALHLGNYFGAVSQWVKMQNEGEDLIISIVDMHAITVPQQPDILRNNIYNVASCLLACGIDVKKTILFQQSSVSQHCELAWVLGCLTTMARVAHLPQYKEKSEKFKEIPLGLFIYPVLQSADILVYRASHVPVGEDQIQQIQLAQHLVSVFNNKYGNYFPFPKAILPGDSSGRVKSLRDPNKKMSKSDPDPRNRIELTDSADVVREKIKKALTDFTSAVTYDPKTRPAVSSLIDIHCLLTGQTPEEVCLDALGLETAQYKLRLADILNEMLSQKRETIAELLKNRDYLDTVLKDGASKATNIAVDTWTEVKKLVGFT